MGMSFLVALVEYAQARERQEVVNLVDRGRFLRDHAREPARRDDLDLFLHAVLAHLPLDAARDLVNLADVAEDDARLHALDCIAADDVLRRHELDARQLGCALEERLRARADARRDDAAQEVAVLRHDIEGRRRADVDDNQRAAVLLVGADDIDDPVRADGARVLVVEADARLDAGPDDQRAQVEIALAHLDEWHDERRHDRRDDDGMDVGHLDALIVEQAVDEHAVLVARLLAVRRDAPVFLEFLAFIGTHGNIRVADI